MVALVELLTTARQALTAACPRPPLAAAYSPIASGSGPVRTACTPPAPSAT